MTMLDILLPGHLWGPLPKAKDCALQQLHFQAFVLKNLPSWKFGF
jgi:hypothetical protein